MPIDLLSDGIVTQTSNNCIITQNIQVNCTFVQKLFKIVCQFKPSIFCHKKKEAVC
jgi:hypothetical protein